MFADLISLVAFAGLRDLLRNMLHHWMDDSLGRMFGLLGIMGITLLTLWIMIHGYRIMTGQSREPLIGFIIQAAKMVVIVSIATNAALYNNYVRGGFNAANAFFTEALTGNNADVYETIDRNLAQTQAIMSGINAISAGLDQAGSSEESDKSALLWQTAFGSGAPAIVAGFTSLFNEFMLALAMALGPFMLICYLFEPTRQLFWNWIKTTIAISVVSIALSITAGFALKVTYAYAAAMLAANFLDQIIMGGGNGQSLASSAFMLCGVGLGMSMLLITVPPAVMIFFQAQLGGSVNGWSSFTSAKGGGGGNDTSKAPGPGLPTKETGSNKDNVDLSGEFSSQAARHGKSADMSKTSHGNDYRHSDNPVIDAMRRNRADGGLMGAAQRAMKSGGESRSAPGQPSQQTDASTKKPAEQSTPPIKETDRNDKT